MDIPSNNSTNAKVQSTNISFYCTICFDTFNETTRPPVILPCGHTFVCLRCAQRLKSCMECRTSLYYRRPKPPPMVQQQSLSHRNSNPHYSPLSYRRTYANNRHSPSNRFNNLQSVKVQPPEEPIPLPLPRNELLLSLLRSSNDMIRNKQPYCIPVEEDIEKDDELPYTHDIYEMMKQSERRSEGKTGAPASIISTSSIPWSSDSEDEEDDHEAERVLVAIESSLSTSGTYVVVDKDGLNLFAEKPQDYIARNLQLDYFNDAEEEKKLPPPRTARLHYGDKVEVVDIQSETVVKLARGKGYVNATSSQLVKIKSPSDDQACVTESLLLSLKPKQRKLDRMLEKLQRVEDKLQKDLSQALRHETPAFVIEDSPPAAPFMTSAKKIANGNTRHVGFHLPQSAPPPPPPSPPEIIKPPKIAVEDEFESIGCTSFFGLGGGGSTAHSSSYQNNNNNNDFDGSTSCAATLTGDQGNNFYPRSFCQHPSATMTTTQADQEYHLQQQEERDNTASNHHENLYMSHTPTSQPSTPTMSSRHPLPLDAVVSPFIDFRTGFSGHLALTSSKGHYHVNANRGQIRMMGEHKGISNIKPIYKRHHYGSSGTTNSNTSPHQQNRPNLSTKTW